jgi:glutamate N-acetyltransferase/amino-acid N-acetyltransferase
MALKPSSALAWARIMRPSASQSSPSGLRHYSAPLDGTIPAAKQKYVPTSGTYPKGFLVSGTHVGVKPTNKSTPDLAFLASETPCAAAAVFTKNKFQAAPVTVSREMLKKRNNSGVRGVIVNSGCANAVTGKGGMEDAEKMGAEADRCFPTPGDGQGGSTIVMSTGVIGQRYVPIWRYIHAISDFLDCQSRKFYTKFLLLMMHWVLHTIIGLLPHELSVPPIPSQNSSREPSPYHHLLRSNTGWLV